MKKLFLLLIPVVLLGIVGLAAWFVFAPEPSTDTNPLPLAHGEIQITDGVKHSIRLEDIVSGGPPKDGIPSIDDPTFESVALADAYLNDDLLGIGIVDGDLKRFYPFQIMVWHEIVNDIVNGTPVTITYCPLCGTAIVYDRRVDGRTLEFGVSGKLYQSNLLMYDRETDSYWSQALGEAVVGELTGKKIELYPLFENTTWKDWKEKYPESEVLSRDTGTTRDYTKTPYEGYERETRLWFPVNNTDDRLPAKEWIAGIVVNDVAKAYPFTLMEDRGEVTDTVGGVEIRIMKDPQNGIKTFVQSTQERIPTIPSFWFSWAAFYPGTLLFE